MKNTEQTLLLVGIIICLGMGVMVYACNEAVCASLVSKCMLLKSCECNMLDKTNCTCCKDCHKCLAKLYTECCSCVGMCENKNPKYNSLKTSSVEELDNPINGLFRVLTEEEDPHLRWTTYTYPAHLDLLYFKPRGSQDFGLDVSASLGDNQEHRVRHAHSHIIVDPDTEAQNCTVAYQADCMSLRQCRESCHSMGAARFRWFHEFGCCECIGSTCLDFGKGEALCLRCSEKFLYEEEEDSVENATENIDEDAVVDDSDEENDNDTENLETIDGVDINIPPKIDLEVAEEEILQKIDANDEKTFKIDDDTMDASAKLNIVESLDELVGP